jgi:hypothetical protein
MNNKPERKTRKAPSRSEYPKTDDAAMRPTKQDNVFRDWPSVDPILNPIRFLLKTAIIETWDRVRSFHYQMELILQLPEKEQSMSQIESILQGMNQALIDLNEVQGWLFPVDRVLSFSQALDTVNLMRQAGFSEDFLQDSIELLTKKRQGRPKTARESAILALEKKTREPDRKWSWRELAQQFCTCKKSNHDMYCRERIRQSTKSLERLLLKFGLSIGE